MVASQNTRPVGRGMVGRWFRQAEMLAGVPPHQRTWRLRTAAGRCRWLRKERASGEATKTVFGWTSTAMVATYGEDQPECAMEEASQLLLKLRRGEIA